MIEKLIKHKTILFLLLIIFLAGVIRFYKLSEYPVSLYWDEVSIAVNANFIAETGKDEYGKNFPLLFKAFNDYKSPGNIYLTAFPVKIFGLNEFSARFVSAFLGTLLVIVMYFLGKNFARLSKKDINIEYFGLLLAFLTAISPWHIQFSRSGFEANSGLFFVTLAITLFIIFLNSSKYKFFYSSSFFFAVSCYFYRSDLIFAPLFLIALLFINFRQFFSKANLIKTFFGLIIFTAVILPFIPSMISSEGMSRGNSVSVFNPENSFDRVYDSIKKYEASEKDIVSKVIYNRRIVYARVFTENYTSYFKHKLLFGEGDAIERHDVAGIGLFYLWQLPFFFVGFFALFLVKRRVSAIILLWLLLAAIPAALSVPSSHALRSLNMLPAYLIVITSGIFIFYKLLPRRFYTLLSVILILVITVSFINYISLYKKSVILYSESWGDGYSQLFSYIDKNKEHYEKFIISGHYWQPYAYALFYTKHDPKTYLTEGNRSQFDKFVFGGTSWEDESELGLRELNSFLNNKNILIALSPKEYINTRSSLDKIGEIKNHNDKTVFILTRPK